MSVNKVDTAIASAQAANASADELRAQLATLAAAVATTNASIAQLATARATRTVRSVTPATVSEADRLCSVARFRKGHRAKMFRELFARGPGVYTLSDLCANGQAAGYTVQHSVPVAEAIARRLSRTPAVGYVLVFDKDEDDNGKSECDFRLRNASDPVAPSDPTDTE
jgi:hypothetical protein